MTRSLSFLLVAIGSLVCGACGGGPPAETGGSAAAGGGAAGGTGVRRGIVPIAFEAKKAGAKPFPFPFVEGKVGGQTTRFIVDTGAGVHAIDTSVATAAQLGTPAKASSISLDGWGTLAEHAVAVRELPAHLRAHGIGGIIAPQLLADSAGESVVVDLVNRQLRMRPRSTASTEMADVGPSLSGPARKLCSVDVDGIPGTGLVVDATVDGEPTKLAIDTGASRTMLLEASKAGVRAAARPVLGRTVIAGASADVAMSIHGAVPFTVGAWSSPLDAAVGVGHRAPPCGAEGRIGMDVLQQCAVAIAGGEMLVSCRSASTTGP
jgi:hypothetical protein